MTIHKDRQSVPQPRYSQFNKDKAKAEGLALITIDIDRRFMNKYDEGNGGSRVTTVGPCSREHYPHLHRAFLIIQGVDIEHCDKVFEEDMKALGDALMQESIAAVMAAERKLYADHQIRQEKLTETPTTLVD